MTGIIEMIKISARAKDAAPSATLGMAAKARQMRSSGINVISFAMGEPDFDTPSFIKEAAIKSLNDGQTKYTPSSGIAELKIAIREKLLRDNGLSYGENEITVTCGAKQAIFNALQAIIDEGDEVIVPAPYWVSYTDQVKLAGGTPVIVSTTAATSFKITPDMLSKFIKAKTRAIILNSPSNPTGSAYTREELAALGDMLCGKDIAIISDEIYEKLVYDDFVHTSIAAACPGIKNQTIVINGVSKAYAMTGWRMGYAAGPKEVISKMTILLEQQISGIPAFVQAGCARALAGPQDEMISMRNEFAARRNLMLKKMQAIERIDCHTPEGAFYLLPNVEKYLGKKADGKVIATSTELADFLLDHGHIATVSGEPFGAPGHLRFSYATSRKNIEEGMKRFEESLRKLK